MYKSTRQSRAIELQLWVIQKPNLLSWFALTSQVLSCIQTWKQLCSVVADCFTKYVEISPIPNQEAEIVAEVLTLLSPYMGYPRNCILIKALSLKAGYFRKCASSLEYIRHTKFRLDL